MPLGFAPEAVETGLRCVAEEDDTFVVSYPKSGTTWLQYIVHLLINSRPIGPDETLSEVFPHLEEAGGAVIEALDRPRLIKTHLARQMTPWSVRAKYLVIARNPFDCAVSFFHHTRGFPKHYDFADGSFSDFFDCFVRGEVDFGDYFDHLAGWYEAAGADNVMLLTYEALSRSTPEVIARIGTFLGGAAADRVGKPAALEGIVAETALGSMRQHQQRWSSRRPAWAPGFVRKGGVGGWRAEFSPREARALLAKFDRRLAGSGARDLWPDILADVREFAEEQ